MIVLHVQHALMNKSVPSFAKQQREITTFKLPFWWILEHSTVNLYFDSAQTNPIAGFFANIVKCEQDGITAISITQLVD